MHVYKFCFKPDSIGDIYCGSTHTAYQSYSHKVTPSLLSLAKTRHIEWFVGQSSVMPGLSFLLPALPV